MYSKEPDLNDQLIMFLDRQTDDDEEKEDPLVVSPPSHQVLFLVLLEEILYLGLNPNSIQV